MHEHECVKCGKKFENMLWMDAVCSECEQEEIIRIERIIINTYDTEKGGNYRLGYVNDYVIPQVKAFINKEVKSLDELKTHGYVPIWDTRNNPVIKKILEQLLNIKLTGIVKRDKITLQNYLS